MKTIAIISQKGGAGKSTLALHLAVAAESAGMPTIVVDLDPQASASSWKDLRKDRAPDVMSAQASRLPQILATAAKHHAKLAVLDTAPHSESTALAAARAADLVIIPCRPAILDLRAISGSVELAKLAAKPACIVLNAVPPRGSLADEAADPSSSTASRSPPCALGNAMSSATYLPKVLEQQNVAGQAFLGIWTIPDMLILTRDVDTQAINRINAILGVLILQIVGFGTLILSKRSLIDIWALCLVFMVLFVVQARRLLPLILNLDLAAGIRRVALTVLQLRAVRETADYPLASAAVEPEFTTLLTA